MVGCSIFLLIAFFVGVGFYLYLCVFRPIQQIEKEYEIKQAQITKDWLAKNEINHHVVIEFEEKHEALLKTTKKKLRNIPLDTFKWKDKEPDSSKMSNINPYRKSPKSINFKFVDRE